MPRCAGQIDQVEDSRRLVYVSWRPDRLASEVFGKLKARLGLSDWDGHGRMLVVVANDPAHQAGEESARIRKFRSEATDFVGIFTTDYLLEAKTVSDVDEAPDLLYFIKAKVCSDDPHKLTMWILPVEAISLRLVSFRNADIPHLDFDWWHGWKGESDRIPLPSDTPRSIQEFDDDMKLRIEQILRHPERCVPCSLHEGEPPDDTP